MYVHFEYMLKHSFKHQVLNYKGYCNGYNGLLCGLPCGLCDQLDYKSNGNLLSLILSP